MNSNTIEQQVFGTIENTLKANATATSTTETAFLVNGNSVAGIATKVLPLSIGNPGIFVGGLYSLSTLANTGLPFEINVWGHVTTGASENLTIKLYVVPAASISGLTATSFTGATSICTSGAIAVNSTTAAFTLSAQLTAIAVSSTSVTLQGVMQPGYINATAIAASATTNVASLQGEGDLNFFVTSTLSSGNAADVVTLDGFSLTLVV